MVSSPGLDYSRLTCAQLAENSEKSASAKVMGLLRACCHRQVGAGNGLLREQGWSKMPGAGSIFFGLLFVTQVRCGQFDCHRLVPLDSWMAERGFYQIGSHPCRNSPPSVVAPTSPKRAAASIAGFACACELPPQTRKIDIPDTSFLCLNSR